MNELLLNSLRRGNQEQIIALLEKGEDPNQEHQKVSLIYWVISSELTMVLDYLINSKKVNLQQIHPPRKGRTPLESALNKGCWKSALKLLSTGDVQENAKKSVSLIMKEYTNQAVAELPDENKEKIVDFLKSVFSLNPNLSLKEYKDDVMPETEENQLVAKAYDQFQLDRARCLSSIDNFMNDINTKVSANSMPPREVMTEIFSYVTPSYVPTYQNEDYLNQTKEKNSPLSQSNLQKSNPSNKLKKSTNLSCS